MSYQAPEPGGYQPPGSPPPGYQPPSPPPQQPYPPTVPPQGYPGYPPQPPQGYPPHGPPQDFRPDHMSGFTVTPGFASTRERRPGSATAAFSLLVVFTVLSGLATMAMLVTALIRLADSDTLTMTVQLRNTVMMLLLTAVLLISAIGVRQGREVNRISGAIAMGALAASAIGLLEGWLGAALANRDPGLDLVITAVVSLLVFGAIGATIALLAKRTTAGWFYRIRQAAARPAFTESAPEPLPPASRPSGVQLAGILLFAVALVIVVQIVMQSVAMTMTFDDTQYVSRFMVTSAVIGVIELAFVNAVAVLVLQGRDVARTLGFVIAGAAVYRVLNIFGVSVTFLIIGGFEYFQWTTFVDMILSLAAAAAAVAATYMLCGRRVPDWFNRTPTTVRAGGPPAQP